MHILPRSLGRQKGERPGGWGRDSEAASNQIPDALGASLSASPLLNTESFGDKFDPSHPLFFRAPASGVTGAASDWGGRNVIDPTQPLQHAGLSVGGPNDVGNR